MPAKKIPAPQGEAGHQYSFDFVRNIAMLCVILYHSVAAYSALAPWWALHDGASAAADFVRQTFDVFMMPAFFLLAGWFLPASFKKRGLKSLLWDKAKRLGAPWALLMLTIVPLIFFVAIAKAPGAPKGLGFLDFWLNGYLSNVLRFSFGASPLAQANQMHLWYISLLLVFFIVAGVVLHFAGKARAPRAVSPSGISSQARALAALALMTTAASFGAALLFPDTSWAAAGLLVQFQPTKVLVYALYFGFGIYAGSRQWFSERNALTRPLPWALASVALTAVYLVSSAQVAAHPAGSQALPPLLLLGYSASRSVLCLAVLMFLLSFAVRHMDKPVALNQKAAKRSFNMYLVHFFIVLFFQGFLMDFTGIPPMAKAAIVFALAVPLSYWLSRAINRFPRSFAAGLAAVFALAAVFMH